VLSISVSYSKVEVAQSLETMALTASQLADLMPDMTGKLTTHVLDTAFGQPAVGMTIELWALQNEPAQRILLKVVSTNSDGRTDAPLLMGNEIQTGVYELVFAVGAYFADKSDLPSEFPFLDRVPIQFGIADTSVHYHVPLLTSPWAYSTYRGS
jgi:5-hydroxyisourate hydrolase